MCDSSSNGESNEQTKYAAKYKSLLHHCNQMNVQNLKFQNRIRHVRREIQYLRRLKHFLIERLVGRYNDRFYEVSLEIPDTDSKVVLDDSVFQSVCDEASRLVALQSRPGSSPFDEFAFLDVVNPDELFQHLSPPDEDGTNTSQNHTAVDPSPPAKRSRPQKTQDRSAKAKVQKPQVNTSISGPSTSGSQSIVVSIGAPSSTPGSGCAASPVRDFSLDEIISSVAAGTASKCNLAVPTHRVIAPLPREVPTLESFADLPDVRQAISDVADNIHSAQPATVAAMVLNQVAQNITATSGNTQTEPKSS